MDEKEDRDGCKARAIFIRGVRRDGSHIGRVRVGSGPAAFIFSILLSLLFLSSSTQVPSSCSLSTAVSQLQSIRTLRTKGW